MSDALRRQIKEFAVPKGSTWLWWFGQISFIFKSPEGTLASIGLCLTDSCASLPYDVNHHELLYTVPQHQPDVLISCINGGFNNLSAWEAAQLVSVVKPKVAIPCHYDMFPDNCADPSQFRAALKVKTPSTKYQELAHGAPFVFSAT